MQWTVGKSPPDNLRSTAMCRGVTGRELTAPPMVKLYVVRMTDPTNTPEFRALSILASAVAETFERLGKSEVFMAKLMLATEGLKPQDDEITPEIDDDPAILWAERLAKQLLTG